MDIKKALEELKKLTTVQEQNFTVPGKYFLDHVAENPAAMQASTPLTKSQDFYKQLLTPVIQARYGNNVEVRGLLLMQLKKYRFVHGACQLSNNRFCTLYFFDDVQTGMLMIADSGHTDFIRLNFWQSQNLSAETIVPPAPASAQH